MTLLAEIPPEEFGDRDAEELSLYVRTLIAAQLEENAKQRDALVAGR